jgi:hypothetical protein
MSVAIVGGLRLRGVIEKIRRRICDIWEWMVAMVVID